MPKKTGKDYKGMNKESLKKELQWIAVSIPFLFKKFFKLFLLLVLIIYWWNVGVEIWLLGPISFISSFKPFLVFGIFLTKQKPNVSTDNKMSDNIFSFISRKLNLGILILSLFHKNFLDLNSSDSSWLKR